MKVDCDSLAHSQKLTPVVDALQQLLEKAKPIAATKIVELLKARNCILAEDLFSTINVPPLDNSAMDGYAVATEDIKKTGATTLPISQHIYAGTTGAPLIAGTAARIFTGAAIPLGADAVYMQEVCEEIDKQVTISTAIDSGENIRLAGEDISQGDCILKTGTRITAQDMGLIASVGIAKVKVYQRLRVAVFFTGDELRQPEETLKAGQIYNSNRFTLHGLLEELDCEVIDLGSVKDTLESTVNAMKQAAQKADLVMTSGGVSVGDADYIRLALEQLGELQMWRISMKPGKPLAFGFLNDDDDGSKSTPFIGLPGNPVSVFVTFLIMARPFIKKMQGQKNTTIQSYKMAAGFDWPKKVFRQEYARARVNKDEFGNLQLSLYPNQSSGVLSSASWADGLAILPEGKTVKKGDLLEFIPI